MGPADRRYEDEDEDESSEDEARTEAGEEPAEEVALDEDAGEPLHLPMLRPEGPPPRTRGDCLAGGPNEVRPCGWITCKWYIHRVMSGAKHSCVLDVADQGGVTLEEVGDIMGITRERVRQIEAKVLRRIKVKDAAYHGSTLKNLVDDAPGHDGWDYHL